MARVKRHFSSVQLRARVTCPHCWHSFPPDETLWISAHSDLRGDPLLGEDEQQRFVPTRFNVKGFAADVKGAECRHLACPRCHLSVSRAFLEMEPLFISILGAPSSGKSYFLASMTWQLRTMLRDHFSLNFIDQDPLANDVLNGYEETLFNNPDRDKLVTLPKTEQQGELYVSVKLGEREVWYPKPFVFSVTLENTHPDYEKRNVYSRALCLYDNAGEHFLPGGDPMISPTQHLALSEVLLFVFDPTQHPRFRERCQSQSADPQWGEHGFTHQQHQVVLEAAKRIRTHTGLPQNAKHSAPLVVVVTKYDAWRNLTRCKGLDPSWVIRPIRQSLSALDLDNLRQISNEVRALMHDLAPEMVSAVEGFSEQVTYIPVSPLGQAPELNRKTGLLGIRPRHIKPMWVEIPMLYALNRALPRLVRAGKSKHGRGHPPASAPGKPAGGRPAKSNEPPSPRLWKETGS